MSVIHKGRWYKLIGATAIEYGLIAALISVVCITVLTSVGTKLNTKFGAVSNALN
jgi:pilus assembly protein Flp/PilA